MKKGQVYEATVERVDFPNKGIVRTEEGSVIVKMSLPGQKIKLCVNKLKNGKAEGRLLEVLEKAPLEMEPLCSHFGVCGGCMYLSLPYGEQIRMKEDQVKRLLDRCLEEQKESWSWEGIKGSPEIYGYRNKMEFTFGDEVKDGPLSLGMHRRGSFYDVVNAEECCIVDQDYRLILGAVRAYFASYPAESGVRPYHRVRHEGYLRHLVVRKAVHTGQILVALVTTSQALRGVQEETLIRGFRDTLLELERTGKLAGRFAGIARIVNDSKADVVQSDRTEMLYGENFFYEELLGLRFKISIFSFFQTNTRGAEVLYDTVREYVGVSEGGDGAEGKVVFDLYSGTGTIAQMLAAAADRVIGVEIVEEAVWAARRNAEENGLDNCTFIAGDVLKVLDTVEEKPDLVILDPPRDGIHPKALPKIGSYGVDRILYISCKPTSLVRDIVEFGKFGYAVERACCIDMFPHTANIETVVMLSHKNLIA